jgi:ubiquinone/menaquinone biosynthesis C-methylase UbiE
MKTNVDLSGAAFGDVDKAGDAASVVSYLDEASNQFRAVKAAARSLLALKSNEKVLDVGCGTGDDAHELAAIVAPDGLAIGVDKSKSMIDEARRRVQGFPLPLQFELGEVEHLPWKSNHFDACRADRLLQHLLDPDEALNEMVRVLRPGGRIVVVDRDWGMVALDSADPVTTQAVLDRACAGIRNGWIGRKLYRLFRKGGLSEIHVETYSINLTSFEKANALLDLQIVTDHAVSGGHIAQQAANAWVEDLLERNRLGTFFATLTLYVAFGRKQ